MYIPKTFAVTDIEEVRRFIHGHGFATLISDVGGRPFASHLPILLDRNREADVLRSHMARANEQWNHFSPDREVLAIFQGPHAYISPSWYVNDKAVPTWNYTTVHVYGVAHVEKDPKAVRRILEDTVVKYERPMEQPWLMKLPEDDMVRMQEAIVGFSIRVTRVEAKFKLGQNKTPADQEGMLAGLRRHAGVDSMELARFMDGRRK